MVRGFYSFGDIARIECTQKNDNINTKTHEAFHIYLNQTTLFGRLIIALTFTEAEGACDLKDTILQLHDASVITQESFVISKQLLSTYDNKTEFNQYLSELKENDSLRKYFFIDFEKLLFSSIDYSELESVINEFCSIAMNIDLTSIENVNWFNSQQVKDIILKHPILYRPDTRFKKLIQLFTQIINRSSEELDFAKIKQSVLDESLLLFTEMTLEAQLKMSLSLREQLKKYNKNVKTVSIDKNIEDTTEAIKNPLLCVGLIDMVDHMNQCLIPTSLTTNFTMPDSCHLEKNDYEADAVQVFLNDKKTNFPCGRDLLDLHFITSRNRKRVLLSRTELYNFLINYTHEIIFFIEDFSVVKNQFNTLFNKRVFFRLDFAYHDLKPKLEPIISPNREIYFHYMNRDVTYIFFKGKDNCILFSPQFNENLGFFKNDLVSGYFKYINIGEDDSFDNCFYTDDGDANCFENVVSSCSCKYFFDDKHTMESPKYDMGRIILKDDFIRD